MSETNGYGYVCKQCGGAAPTGIGYATAADGAAAASKDATRCPCGYSAMSSMDRWEAAGRPHTVTHNATGRVATVRCLFTRWNVDVASVRDRVADHKVMCLACCERIDPTVPRVSTLLSDLMAERDA